MSEIISFDKITTAKEHLDAAIEMTFLGMNAIPVHVLVDSAHQILFALSEHQALEGRAIFENYINPEHKKEFWSKFRRVSSFSKHADRDPNGEIETM